MKAAITLLMLVVLAVLSGCTREPMPVSETRPAIVTVTMDQAMTDARYFQGAFVEITPPTASMKLARWVSRDQCQMGTGGQQLRLMEYWHVNTLRTRVEKIAPRDAPANWHIEIYFTSP